MKQEKFPTGIYETWLEEAEEQSKKTKKTLEQADKTEEEVYKLFPEMRPEKGKEGFDPVYSR